MAGPGAPTITQSRHGRHGESRLRGGTNSGEALAAVGAGLLIWGVQLVRAKKAQNPG